MANFTEILTIKPLAEVGFVTAQKLPATPDSPVPFGISGHYVFFENEFTSDKQLRKRSYLHRLALLPECLAIRNSGRQVLDPEEIEAIKKICDEIKWLKNGYKNRFCC